MEQINLEAAGLFFNLLIANEDLNITTSNKSSNQTLYDIAGERYKLGKISENDLMALRLELVSATRNKMRAEQSVRFTSSELLTFLGMEYEGQMIVPRTPEVKEDIVVDAQFALEQAMKNRYEIDSQVRTLLEAERDIAETKGNGGLNADLTASIGLIISLVISYGLYRSLIRPLQFLYSGVDAIQDKDFNIKFVKTGSREMDKLIDVYNNMIDNIRTERTQVQEQHYFLMKLINASPTGIVILDFDGSLAEINPKAIELLRLPRQQWQQVVTKESHPILEQIIEIPVDESAIISDDGFEKFKCQVSHFIHKGFKRKFILIQELSGEILEAEERAYGKIIRMMAHEVNNSIGAINSILNTMADYFEEEQSEWSEPLSVAIQRNKSMNKFMANFAKVVRLPQPNLERVEVNQLVRNGDIAF